MEGTVQNGGKQGEGGRKEAGPPQTAIGSLPITQRGAHGCDEEWPPAGVHMGGHREESQGHRARQLCLCPTHCRAISTSPSACVYIPSLDFSPISRLLPGFLPTRHPHLDVQGASHI